MAKELIFNAFLANDVANQCTGQWRHPRDETWRYKYLDHWTGMAKLLERGKFDSVFIADQLGILDRFGESPATTIRRGGQSYPMNDALMPLPAMAAVTEHLGLAVTSSIVQNHPFPFARSMSTLDHLTGGRCCWNVVTSFTRSASEHMGHVERIGHDKRYQMADEYMEVCYKLWEGCWEDGARPVPDAKDFFADPSKIHKVEHAGEFFRTNGLHLTEPSPQRTPVLAQAGTSGAGTAFAAKHAEIVFTALPDAKSLHASIQRLVEQAATVGRSREDFKVLNWATAVVAETDAEAQRLHDEYREYDDPEAVLSSLSGVMDIDLSKYPMDEPIAKFESEGIRSFVDIITDETNPQKLTLREIARNFAWGMTAPVFVGSAQTVADQMQEWCEVSDSDGFNLASCVYPETFESYVDLLVPELQSRGAYKKEYRPGTYREKVFGRGDRLGSAHPADGYRVFDNPVEPAPVG